MELNCNNLNSSFKLYFHDPNSYDWNIGSYIKLCKIKTIEDYWLIENKLHEKIHLGMFFIMRDNIFPLWDNDDNINGCSFSFKILKIESKDYWNSICISLLSETLLKNQNNWNNINGISISPKKNFCIIKIWLKNKELYNNKNVNEYFNIPNNYKGEIVFKDHKIDK
jgi:hypothetical protein|tara:strand:+ start:289 stop:789 length:501 start_codon:yes stop_codon:yes gene_type:complete